MATESRIIQAGFEVEHTATVLDTQTKQAGMEVEYTVASVASRIIQGGIEVVYTNFTVLGVSLLGPRLIGTAALVAAISLPSLVGPLAIGTPTFTQTLSAPSLLGPGLIGEGYVTNAAAIVGQSLVGPRTLGTPTLQAQIVLSSLVGPRAIGGNALLTDDRTIYGESLLGPRTLGVHSLAATNVPRTLRLRAQKVTYGPPGLIMVDAVDEDTGNYPLPEFLGGVPADGGASTVAPVPGSTKLFLFDPVLLRDADDGAIYYAAVSGFNDAWRGTTLSKSGDGGSTYEDILTFEAGEESVMGYAASVLATTATPEAYDRVNTLDVQLLKGDTYQLFSDSEINVLNGANAGALICSDGRVEEFQWMDALLVSPGVYRVSTLLRGRKGSEYAMTGHALGDRFILLDPNTVRAVGSSLSEFGLERLYKATSLGTSIIDAAVARFTPTGNPLRPLSMIHIQGTRDGGNNLTVTGIRRTRIGQEWRDLLDAPLGEASENYEMDVWNAGLTAVLRTIPTTTPSFPYSSANQTTDFGSPQAAINIKIYQISATIGRGFVASAVV